MTALEQHDEVPWEVRMGLAEPSMNGHSEDAPPAAAALRIVSYAQFAAVTEDTADPILGVRGDTLLPANGLLFMYGDGGAGKTTLSVDALAHLASGTPWLDTPVHRPIKTLLIENEGPRGPFREMLAAKASGWQGDSFAAHAVVLEDPWTHFTLTSDLYRQALAEQISALGIEFVIVGPLASLGARGAGTPDDVNDFAVLIRDLRDRCPGQPFALWIVHHENKAGDVSGAWERLPDTLVHVSAQGNGRTRVHWRKVRWSSRMHNTSVILNWAGGGFEIEEAKIRDLRVELLEAVTNDDKWRTAKESAGLIASNIDKIRPVLSQLVEDGLLRYEEGPAGRTHSAKCWRLAAQGSLQLEPEPEPEW